MDVNSFLKSRVKPAPVSAEPSAVTEGEGLPSLTEEIGRGSSRGPADSPSVVYNDTTPSGIRVTYTPGDGTKENPRQYTVNGEVVPSVTTVLGVLDKKSLGWWGQGIGVAGVLELFRRGALYSMVDWEGGSFARIMTAREGEASEPADAENVVKLLTAEKLTVNHVLNRAGDRGTSVHDALDNWAQSGGEFFPTPQNYSDEKRPYVEGLLAFLDQFDGSLKPVRCEVMVGSAEHGFAGRYDLDVEVWQDTEVVTKAYKKRQPKTEVIPQGVYKLDLKTSSGVYDSHHLQLAAYELACIECGYPETDAQFVLHVTKDGQHELVRSRATADQFLAVKGAYDALKGLK